MANVASFSDLLVSAYQSVQSRSWVLLRGAAILAFLGIAAFFPVALITILPDVPALKVAFVCLVLCIIIVLLQVAYLYVIIALVGKDATANAILQKAFKKFLPMFALAWFSMLRSYTWITLIGIPFFFSESLRPLGIIFIIIGGVLGLIYGPRLWLSPVLWIKENTTTRKAVDSSFVITQGYWWKIFGNTVLFGLLAQVVMLLIGLLAGVIVALLYIASMNVVGDIFHVLLNVAVMLYYYFFNIAFTVALYETVKKNPRTSKRTKNSK
jgi:hypothetical protein